jgi:PAS domain S-box-containing protein
MQAAEQSSDLVMITDRTGRIEYVNPAFEAAYGYSLEDLRGQTPRLLGSGAPQATVARLWSAVLDGRSFRGTFVNRRRDGSSFCVDETVTGVLGRGARVTRIVATSREARPESGIASLSVPAVREPREAEVTAEVGRLMAGLAHEVRNPLFAISSMVDAFEEELGRHAGLGEFCPRLRHEIDRLAELMENLLDYWMPGSGEPVVTDLVEVIRHVVSECGVLVRSKGVEVVTDYPPRTASVLGRPSRLSQVFLNVLRNAVQHSPSGGHVILRVEDSGAVVTVTVLDSGAGFPTADLSRVFEPFFTRHRGATGMELAIVHRVVAQHRGMVTAENRPEGGACLTVRIPRATGVIS